MKKCNKNIKNIKDFKKDVVILNGKVNMANEISINYKGIKITPNTDLRTLGTVGAELISIFDANKDGKINNDNEEWDNFMKGLEMHPSADDIIKSEDAEQPPVSNTDASQNKPEADTLKTATQLSNPELQNNEILQNGNIKTVKYYDREFQKIEKKLDKLGESFQKISKEFLALRDEFDNKYSDNIKFTFLKQNEDAPDGYKKYNIESFGIGVYDEKKGKYTGEIEKFAYIEGLEKLSEDEQKDCIKLFEKMLKLSDKWSKLSKEEPKLHKQIQYANAMRIDAENGYIPKVMTEDEEQSYINIYDTTNPYSADIQRAIADRNKIWYKGYKTQEDYAEIEKYNAKIEQLSIASYNWSLSKSGKDYEKQKTNFSNEDNVRATIDKENKRGNVTYSVASQYNDRNAHANAEVALSSSFYNNNGDTGVALQSTVGTDVGFKYSKLLIDMPLNLTMGYGVSNNNHKGSFSLSDVTQGLNIRYKGLNVSETYNYNHTESGINENVMANARFNQDGWSVAGNLNASHSQMIAEENSPEQSQNTPWYLDSKIELGKTFGLGNANVYYNYQAGSHVLGNNASFNLSKKEGNFEYNMNPAIGFSYNVTNNIANVNPQLVMGLGYKQDNVEVKLNMSETNNTIIQKNRNYEFEGANAKKYNVNAVNTLSTNASVSYRGIVGAFGYTANYQSGEISHTVTTSVGGEVAPGVTLQGEYDYSSATESQSHTASVKVTVNLDKKEKRYKKKKCDNKGKEIRISKDTNGDGKNDVVANYKYDSKGKIVWSEVREFDINEKEIKYAIDKDGDGKDDWIRTNEYDNKGNKIKCAIDRDGDGKDDSITIYKYNDEGKIVDSETHDYDSDGNEIKYLTDENLD